MTERGRIRDRRGRGIRGPEIGSGRPRPSRRQRFDDLVLGTVTEVERRWQYAVEDTPMLPDDWDADSVPLSSLIRGTGATPTRIVLFRRPIEHRCASREDLEALVLTVVVEQVAELLGIDAEDVDPRYRAD